MADGDGITLTINGKEFAMYRTAFLCILAALLVVSGCSDDSPEAAGPDKPVAVAQASASVDFEDLKIHQGVRHKNLTVFMITGPEPLKGRDLLTLDEALDQKKIVIRETGNVNQLEAINQSDVDVFIPSGSIFRGGKQDRMCPHDYIIGAGEKVPLQSFCVERGRWTQRGAAPTSHFTKSGNFAYSRELKAASQLAQSQGAVWSGVARKQMQLSESLEAEVEAPESRSSLELTLDNKKLNETIEETVKALEDLPADQGPTVGFAWAVNGKVHMVDTYGSSELFARLWPKLLRSAAVEAVAAEKDQDRPQATAEQVRDLLQRNRQAKESKNVGGGKLVNTIQTEETSARALSADGDIYYRDSVVNTEGIETAQPEQQYQQLPQIHRPVPENLNGPIVQPPPMEQQEQAEQAEE
jgi:hypothetical protein